MSAHMSQIVNLIEKSGLVGGDSGDTVKAGAGFSEIPSPDVGVAGADRDDHYRHGVAREVHESERAAVAFRNIRQ
jgi:hypothetical protein